MLELMIEMKALVVRPEIVANPASVLVDMGRFRMPRLVTEAALFLVLLWGSAHRRRPVWRDVLAAVVAVLTSSFLRIERDAQDE
jgi:hypothetical protein